MNKDEIKGKFEDVKGKIKRSVGKVTGNESQQVEGGLEQGKGKVQGTFGEAKESVRDAFDRDKNERAAS